MYIDNHITRYNSDFYV